MANSTSANLKLTVQATGENSGTWGQITNTNLLILEQAIGGFTTFNLTNANRSLTFSIESGIDTVLLAAKVPVNLITSFFPLDNAPLENVKDLLALVKLKVVKPPIACSRISKFVFVI